MHEPEFQMVYTFHADIKVKTFLTQDYREWRGRSSSASVLMSLRSSYTLGCFYVEFQLMLCKSLSIPKINAWMWRIFRWTNTRNMYTSFERNISNRGITGRSVSCEVVFSVGMLWVYEYSSVRVCMTRRHWKRKFCMFSEVNEDIDLW